MPIDGLMLSLVGREIKENVLNMRIDKIYQPSADEIIFNMRSKEGFKKLHFSVSSDSPHVNITSVNVENPSNPPMFCMFLRKYLTGCTITDIYQESTDRILFFELSGTNIIGDPVNYKIVFEAMPRHADFIILNSEDIIIECLKKSDYNQIADRAVLPGFKYKLPPRQLKLNLFETETEVLADSVLKEKELLLSSAFIKTVEGISPLISREAAERTAGADIQISQMNIEQRNNLSQFLNQLKNTVLSGGKPVLLKNEEGKPFDVSYIDILQYGSKINSQVFKSYSELIEFFYYEKSRIERTGQQSKELQKSLTNLIARSNRKLFLRQNELKECENKDKYRIYAEIILSNQYSLKKGSFYYDLPNYYDNCNIIRIPADPALSPAENARKYFKEYNKLKNAENLLGSLISDSIAESEYLESVLDAVNRANGANDIYEIKNELSQQGFLKNKKSKKVIKSKPLPPLEYISDDGYKILVGRNNTQNDILTFKTADKTDSWFHTQKFPGSHVVVIGNREIIPELTCRQAAVIAATNSSAGDSSQVAVDYTEIRHIKKPSGAKPGKVIYHTYNTMWVTPDKNLCERLKTK